MLLLSLSYSEDTETQSGWLVPSHRTSHKSQGQESDSSSPAQSPHNQALGYTASQVREGEGRKVSLQPGKYLAEGLYKLNGF